MKKTSEVTNDNNVIVSLTTIPGRKNKLMQTLPYILNQKYVKKICINLDNNLSPEDYTYFEKEIASKDSRIEIDKTCDPKWRSANKLLPTIQKYPDDVIVTMDDDLSYDPECVAELYETYLKNPDCIIAQEINPVVFTNGELRYLNTLDIMLMQKEFGKYLTHSCLFPPHTFDNTDVFNYDKMKQVTNGTHDEFWFWIHTTLKGIKSIGLDQTISMAVDTTIKHEDNEYQLTSFNQIPYNIDRYNWAANMEYGEQFRKLVNDPKNSIDFFVNRTNLMGHVFALSNIKSLYGGYPHINFYIDIKTLKKSHVWFLETRLQMEGYPNTQVHVLPME